jgi:hypothetical protein
MAVAKVSLQLFSLDCQANDGRHQKLVHHGAHLKQIRFIYLFVLLLSITRTLGTVILYYNELVSKILDQNSKAQLE